MSVTVADVLRQARSYVEQGWRQGGYVSEEDENGQRKVCAETARMYACFKMVPTYEYGPMVCAFYNAIRLPLERRGFIRLIEFNDDPTTTQADVLALFDEAIAGPERAS